jgi:hypothetical protein
MYKLINPQGNEKCFKSVYELDDFYGRVHTHKNFQVMVYKKFVARKFQS